MNELEQILDYLRTLQERDWPVRIDGPHKMQAFVLYPGEFRYFDFPLDWQNPQYWFYEEVLRGFIEREIETRGLWKRYLEAITTRSAPSQNGKGVLRWRDTEHRPTLLEVLEAALSAMEVG